MRRMRYHSGMHVTVETAAGNSFAVDWNTWAATDRAVLTFVRRNGQLLLILKKRGLGAGKFNAPGGRIEPGETPEAAAVRETQEELCVTPSGLRSAGRLRFAFTNGYGIDCLVFTAENATGEPTETDEAVPHWCGENEIPYQNMWADDRVWIPLMLAGKLFDARFVFDDDLMLWHVLRLAKNRDEL
jgi:8-oxo-dGTP diphosphatase